MRLHPVIPNPRLVYPHRRRTRLEPLRGAYIDLQGGRVAIEPDIHTRIDLEVGSHDVGDRRIKAILLDRAWIVEIEVEPKFPYKVTFLAIGPLRFTRLANPG